MNESEKNRIILQVHIDTSELDAVTEKAQHLKELLEEASSLANELASKEISLSVEVKD